MADWLVVRAGDPVVRDGVRSRQHLYQGPQQGEAAMIGKATAHSVVEASAVSRALSGSVVVLYALITITPLLWIFLTSIKTPSDSVSYPPKVFSEPTVEGYCNLFTFHSRQDPEYIAHLPPPIGRCDRLARSRGMVIAGASKTPGRLLNSLIIGFGSTFLSVFLGTLAAYAFSRFKVPAKDDLTFFILSTRFMPPIAVAIPIYLMYRQLGLIDTALGMILLYTSVNVSLAVWLLKGVIDEIPREYGKAALVDGYTRLQAFRQTGVPPAGTRVAATAGFCLIFAWNESAFAVLLTIRGSPPVPPLKPLILGDAGQDCSAV